MDNEEIDELWAAAEARADERVKQLRITILSADVPDLLLEVRRLGVLSRKLEEFLMNWIEDDGK